ncbi:C2H2-type zinc finger protein, partial [Escherichia coli]|uniref:C2H2-type zinc finger protein n=1 Tax=Escherichia coli TaxID=562 RepID=UPI00203DA030
MEELFTCPICKLSFGHKARLRKHIKKHTKSLEKNLAKANSTKKAEHEKMLIQERIARTGSAFKNESERNKGTVAKLAMRQPFVLFKGLTFQKLCLP